MPPEVLEESLLDEFQPPPALILAAEQQLLQRLSELAQGLGGPVRGPLHGEDQLVLARGKGLRGACGCPQVRLLGAPVGIRRAQLDLATNLHAEDIGVFPDSPATPAEREVQQGDAVLAPSRQVVSCPAELQRRELHPDPDTRAIDLSRRPPVELVDGRGVYALGGAQDGGLAVRCRRRLEAWGDLRTNGHLQAPARRHAGGGPAPSHAWREG
mmetsp:Transcript_4320/g.13997  ORF Transcript_4320/g.13997 Transcript_4320/m.13997 type:complete len:213 (+) Transcript_4320:1122-1760(+)